MKYIWILPLALVLYSFSQGLTSAAEANPTLTICPGPGGQNGLNVSEGFAILSFTGEAVVRCLPSGYALPRDIIVYKLDDPGKQYHAVLGQTPLSAPSGKNITVPLSGEMKVDLQEGLTQVQFVGQGECKEV